MPRAIEGVLMHRAGAARALAWLTARLGLGLAVSAAALALWHTSVEAASWGGITPGTSSVEEVRGRYGQPSRETPKKVEGYDTLEWVYEGARAPSGIVRMTIEFGLLTPQGYKGNLVRTMTLEPKPRIFMRDTIVDGWGVPQRMAEQGDRDVFLYESGLVVTFDRDGFTAVNLIFMVPQKVGAGGPVGAPQPSATPTPPRR